MIFLVLQLGGAAALLLWSVRLVRTGVERAYSLHLRRWLRRSADSRMMAAGTGAGAALALQSSTAVAMLVTAFAASGALNAPTGLAMLLGADVGSALVVRVLMLDLAWLIPILLIAGVAMFLRGDRRPVRQTGRILVGLALILVSLGMIRTTTEPLRDSEALTAAMQYLGGDPVTAFAIGAILAWALHSSVAAVLVFVTLVAQGLLPVGAAVALVLGANLGGTMIPVMLTLKAAPVARRIVIANAVLRGGGAVLVLALFAATPLDPALLGATGGQQVINLHLAFNLVVALIGIPVVGAAIAGARIALPDAAGAGTALARLTALDPAALKNPERAIGCATREILRIGEAIEAMLNSVIGLYSEWDEATANSIREREDNVDRMYFETKLYLARLHRGALDEDTAEKGMDLATIAINMEGAADAISRDMLALAGKMHEKGVSFSDAGWRDICDFHDRVLSNVQLALNVLMSRDPDLARQLVEEKEHVRRIESEFQRRHLDRLRKGAKESIETSNIHQETLRALKQVNTAVAMVAYPILAESGELLSSRLAEPERQAR